MAPFSAWLRLVRFSHSVFALPFALMSALLAARGLPSARAILLITACCVAARTAAMAFNRLVDRRIDAANPRTRARELPAGVLQPRAVAVLVIVASAVFVAGAFALSSLCGWLSLPVLCVLLGYSFTKRFTAAAHLVLGPGPGLAPLGAWIAVRGELDRDLGAPLWLAGAVVCWVAGFDILYACQDEGFDRDSGLASLPARCGIARALGLAKLLHVIAVALLAALAYSEHLSPWFWAAVMLVAVLLWAQHRLVRPDDLSRIDLAFFTFNGWVGFILLLGVVGDVYLPGGRT